ncbi:MAG: hypothetical protein ACOYK2_02885 [Polynucleobacter sp.]
MTSTLSDFSYFLLFRNALFGIACLISILIFHGISINFVSMHFERLTLQNLSASQYYRVFFHFYRAFVVIALIHLLEILFWSLFIIGLDLIKDPVEAILFAGSCYTTAGFAPDTLPIGWKTLAFFISFTGLFSLAWTTSIMIGMTASYKQAWNQKYNHYRPDQH